MRSLILDGKVSSRRLEDELKKQAFQKLLCRQDGRFQKESSFTRSESLPCKLSLRHVAPGHGVSIGLVIL
ncbi:hypothetical protein IM774_02635 [Erysipelotrichaceae bacterium RD49]|nr:hypothetical protein [Erysipelotrichaceae bacterium RD49]